MLKIVEVPLKKAENLKNITHDNGKIYSAKKVGYMLNCSGCGLKHIHDKKGECLPCLSGMVFKDEKGKFFELQTSVIWIENK
jgi:hypothetical protein